MYKIENKITNKKTTINNIKTHKLIIWKQQIAANNNDTTYFTVHTYSYMTKNR